MSRWPVAGVAVAVLAYLVGVFAATYSLVAWLWERWRS